MVVIIKTGVMSDMSLTTNRGQTGLGTDDFLWFQNHFRLSITPRVSVKGPDFSSERPGEVCGHFFSEYSYTISVTRMNQTRFAHRHSM